MPSEAWVARPNILSQNVTSGGFQLGFAAVPGYAYTAQFANSLSRSNQWTTLTATNGEDSVGKVTVADPAPDPVTRVYRLARTPSP